MTRRLNTFLQSSKLYYEIDAESNSSVPKLIIQKRVGPAKVTVVTNKYVLITGSIPSLKLFQSFLDVAANNRRGESYHFDHTFSNNHVSSDSIRVMLTVE
jgi:hypothetical protein